ncbi:MAG: (deoxy)nucleoside triphosphate pyrophosphohydrolase [Sphingobium sp.]|nr:(deoxy)nucleoside triphosphate pyrophosphohydrolase [Sphingobium sp.]MBP6110852.1 (deoxy)nucleoside triphosphate pyrophosphohydrolase [Sphingobium sp.]MBP8670004.1 (deoxy)nucleoside triphosphate pyrophosphohydrolase [Sphingobium sp.]MBP9157131.1 (deoxy)nucleoside triphosphate pyrophosphohydrolase [Sphingobium sp.]MCC6481080.1 (deoxy)nucleoside triphosphate pyrophosphohydrolase [Sphingomonadaceae bacterium]
MVEALTKSLHSGLPQHRPLIVVAAALVDAGGRVLLQQRPEGKAMAGLWEFPGGKVDAGETLQAALVRELEEELGILTHESCLAPATFANGRTEDGQELLLLLYVCRKWTGVPYLRHAAALRWARPTEMFALPMPPADLPMIGVLDALV